MKLITKESVEQGAVFVYPTDTIYGIGCNALDSIAISRLRSIKGQHDRPVSVIAPSKDWIRENCFVTEEALAKLPGPYTLILKLKTSIIPKEINLGSGTLGVRMPDHWISDVVSEIGIPIVTTSANKTGEGFMTCLDNLNKDVSEKVDFIVYDGELSGRPSTIINLLTDEVINR